jgi:hypothetical protein
MSLGHGTSIVRSGLLLALDAANPKSYPGSGTVWTDLSGNGAHGTINGIIPFVSSGAQSYFNFETADNSKYISSTVPQNYVDMTIVFQPDFTRVGGAAIAGLISDSTPAASTDNSLRFGVVNGTGPWSISARNPGDLNDWSYLTGTTYYVNSTASNTLVAGWNIFGGYRTNQGANFPVNFSYFIGSSGYPGRGFQGKIAAVYMYNRQLSATEQTQNFEALRGRYGI